MTSEAKIGLLLGLVVIFIIALVVNGLPSFHKDDSTNELTRDIVRLDNSSPALAERERQVSREVLNPNINLQPTQLQTGTPLPNQQTNNADARNVIAPPGNQSQGSSALTVQGHPAGGNLTATSEQPTTPVGITVPNQTTAGGRNVLIPGPQSNTPGQQGAATENTAVRNEHPAKKTEALQRHT